MERCGEPSPSITPQVSTNSVPRTFGATLSFKGRPYGDPHHGVICANRSVMEIVPSAKASHMVDLTVGHSDVLLKYLLVMVVGLAAFHLLQ